MIADANIWVALFLPFEARASAYWKSLDSSSGWLLSFNTAKTFKATLTANFLPSSVTEVITAAGFSAITIFKEALARVFVHKWIFSSTLTRMLAWQMLWHVTVFCIVIAIRVIWVSFLFFCSSFWLVWCRYLVAICRPALSCCSILVLFSSLDSICRRHYYVREIRLKFDSNCLLGHSDVCIGHNTQGLWLVVALRHTASARLRTFTID